MLVYYPVVIGDGRNLFVKNPFLLKCLLWSFTGRFKLDDCYKLVPEEDTSCVCGV